MISFAFLRTRSFKSGSFIAGGFNFSWSSGVSRGNPTSRRTSIRASWSVSSRSLRLSQSDNSVWACVRRGGGCGGQYTDSTGDTHSPRPDGPF